jgi:hypothetical protein
MMGVARKDIGRRSYCTVCQLLDLIVLLAHDSICICSIDKRHTIIVECGRRASAILLLGEYGKRVAISCQCDSQDRLVLRHTIDHFWQGLTNGLEMRCVRVVPSGLLMVSPFSSSPLLGSNSESLSSSSTTLSPRLFPK